MMLFVIVGVFSGIYAIAFLGLPIFLSAILGVSIGGKETRNIAANTARIVRMEGEQRQEQKVS